MGNAGGLPINADTTQITDPQVQQFNTLFAQSCCLATELDSIPIGLSLVTTRTWSQPPRN